MMRCSPFKQGKPLQRKTPMARGTGFKTPASGAGLLRVAAVQAQARAREPKVPKLPKPMKSRGMKGRPPTADEARFMTAIAALGCIACRKDGRHEPIVSIHHIDGRTKPGAHFLILPLCGPHHQQDDTDLRGRISVHGMKATFQARYGTQQELLAECLELIKDQIGSRQECAANNLTAE